MSDKWQQISLRLDADLARVLRDMKQSHAESVSDVVLRLLRKAVRQSLPGPRGAVPGRVSPKAATGRGAFGDGKRGKPVALAAPAEYDVAAQGKRSAPRAAPAAAAWGAPRGKRKPAGTAKPRRFIPAPSVAPAPRRGGKAARPQQLDGSGEPRRRDFRPADGPRSMGRSDERGTAEGRPKRPRKVKGRPSSRS